jgi:Arc/MetJ family transcription regulator
MTSAADRDLLAEVMRIHRIDDEGAAIDYALRRLASQRRAAAEPLTREDALAMRGTGWVVSPDPSAEAGTATT